MNSTLPKFTKRAAAQIEQLVRTYANDLPPDKYMPCVGWEVGFDSNFVPGPIMGLHEVERTPNELQIECHGIKLAYNIPEEVMASLHSSVLDFDGRRFLFVNETNAE